MSNEKLIPKLRFKEFNDPWEVELLGSLVQITTGKLDANAMNPTGKYDFYTSGIQKYRIDTPAFEGPAITIAGNGATVGYMHLADGKFNAYQRTYVLTKFNSDRYFTYIKIGKQLPRKIREEARMGNIPYIVMDMLTDLKISRPSQREQIKIGGFFKKIDEMIQLQQSKLSKVKNIKSAYLSEMFPKEGEKYPKKRFEGFTEPWKEEYLGNLSSVTTGALDANAMNPTGKYDFYTSGIQKYRIDTPAFEGPAITIAGNGATVGYMHLADGKFNAYQRTYVLTQFYAVREFIYLEIGRKLPVKIRQEARMGNIPYIVMDMLVDLTISLPSYEEQKEIAKFFENLDNQITNEEEKLAKLEKLKQAYLNDMFV